MKTLKGVKMAELYLIRHAQASFGADNCDRLSDLGHQQSQSLGKALADQGVNPDFFHAGDMQRHRETLEGIQAGLGHKKSSFILHTVLNEFDSTGLLNARFRKGGTPALMHKDRKVHFRTLHDTVLAWQQNQIEDPPESWGIFCARIEAAWQAIMIEGPKTVLAVSSGGVIAQMTAALLQTSPEQQIKLQLQLKNCAVKQFIFSVRSTYLNGLNETLHITAASARPLSYS